ncbi:MAG: twin-arginine translocase subunit TatC, partial [Candidatus Dormibacteraceae bacterium]
MALLIRRPEKKKIRSPDGTMSITEHLEDLRRALIIAAIGWLVCSVAAWFFTVDLLHLIEARAGVGRFVFFGPTGAFMLRLKIALFAGTLAASPVIFWQIWWFVSPGLHTHEKRIVLPLIAATTFFFLLGVSFCFYALPLVIHVLTGFAPDSVLQFIPSGDDFLGFLLVFCLAFGLVFELPVVLWTLGMLKIVSSRWLWSTRLYWFVGLGLLSNVMTPGADPLTPLIIFAPLLV